MLTRTFDSVTGNREGSGVERYGTIMPVTIEPGGAGRRVSRRAGTLTRRGGCGRAAGRSEFTGARGRRAELPGRPGSRRTVGSTGPGGPGNNIIFKY